LLRRLDIEYKVLKPYSIGLLEEVEDLAERFTRKCKHEFSPKYLDEIHC